MYIKCLNKPNVDNIILYKIYIILFFVIQVQELIDICIIYINIKRRKLLADNKKKKKSIENEIRYMRCRKTKKIGVSKIVKSEEGKKVNQLNNFWREKKKKKSKQIKESKGQHGKINYTTLLLYI